MSKRTGELLSQECSKKPNLNNHADLISIPYKFEFGDDWNVYRARLEDYFNSEGIYDDTRKISIFIALLGQEVYKTIHHLCAPVLPNHKTFKQLCEVMEKYFKISIHKNRRQFYRLQQFVSKETINQWYTRVIKTAAQCAFGDQLDDKIKDQFVNGMEEGEILECIFNAGIENSLQNILEIALKKEQELGRIEKLPEEIFIYIFNYLPIADRIRIERVNKSWQETAKKCWNKFRELKMKSMYLGLEVMPVTIDRCILEAIVKRCRNYLEKIDVYTLDFTKCALPVIANHCPNIKSINCNKASVKGLKKLSENCRNIVEMRIIELEEGYELDKVLGDLFSRNKKLQTLDILRCERNDVGFCLSKLPFDEIIALKIPCLRYFEESIVKVIEKSKNLSTFKYGIRNANVFTALENNCRNLAELDLKLDYFSKVNKIDGC